MIIVAGGDSFIYGSELADCNNKPSQHTFTSLLANDYEYQCVAWPGYGNDSIARTVISQCEELKLQDLFVFVSWTFPGRYEFRFAYDTQQKKSPWHSITPWTIEENVKDIIGNNAGKVTFLHKYVNFSGHRPSDEIVEHIKHIKTAKETGIAEFAKTFYQHVGSEEYWEIYSSLKEIVYLQNYLKLNKIPYLFTCADNSILYNYTIDHADQTISSLYKQIDLTNWFWFPAGVNPQDTCNPRGFYQWAVENKYRIGTTHPLEEAHQDAANLMKEKFNELVKKSIQ